MKPVFSLVMALAATLQAEPIVYVAQQSVVSLRYQKPAEGPKRLTQSGSDLKRDGSFESKDKWYGDPLLKTEKFYQATLPEGDLLVPHLLRVREGNQVNNYQEPLIPPVIYGWRQFKIGQMNMESAGDLLSCTYTGWLRIDNRAEMVAYTMVLWFQSDRGALKQFVVNVPVGGRVDYTPKLDEVEASVWSMISITAYPK